MSILLALASAAAPAAGSNIGGAFLGAQAGVVYNRIKFKAKENAISKDDASAVYDAVVAALKRATLVNASNDASTKDFTDASEGLSKDGKTFTVKYNATNDADAKATHDYVAKTLEAAFSSGKLTKDTGLNIVVTKNKSSSSADAAGVVSALSTKKDDIVAARVQQDNEIKYTGTTGLVGLHAGYLYKFSPCFGLGALVEGSWSFAQDLKLEGKDKETDFTPRFGVNGLVRAVYFATPKFFFGADVGLGLQEFRYVNGTKADAKTDSKSKSDSKDSKWGWNLVGHALAGMAINDNVVVTAKVGGGFPVKDQDWKERGDRKFRYYDVQGTLGLSYYLGA